MIIDELDMILAAGEREMSKHDNPLAEEREKADEENAQVQENNIVYPHDSVLLEATTIRESIEGKITAARKDFQQVDVERERNKKSVLYKAGFVVGAIMLYPILYSIFVGNTQNSVKATLSLIFGLACLAVVFVMAREFTRALLTHLARSREDASFVKNYGYPVLSYEKEKEELEDRAAKLIRIKNECDELVRRSERNGGLTDTEYARLSSLKVLDYEIDHSKVTTSIW